MQTGTLPEVKLMQHLRKCWHSLDHCCAAFAEIWSSIDGPADWQPFDVWWMLLVSSPGGSTAARACQRQFSVSFQAHAMPDGVLQTALCGHNEALQVRRCNVVAA